MWCVVGVGVGVGVRGPIILRIQTLSEGEADAEADAGNPSAKFCAEPVHTCIDKELVTTYKQPWMNGYFVSRTCKSDAIRKHLVL